MKVYEKDSVIGRAFIKDALSKGYGVALMLETPNSNWLDNHGENGELVYLRQVNGMHLVNYATHSFIRPLTQKEVKELLLKAQAAEIVLTPQEVFESLGKKP